MAVVTMRQMLDAGVHFGHQTRRWNPKMKRFIFTERNGIYIIDLQQTLQYIDRAYEFVRETVAHGGTVLFIGTKRQAQEAIAEQATRVAMPYVNQRWLGGMLTNFQTVHKRLQRLKDLEAMETTSASSTGRTKKEVLLLTREKDKLAKTLGGIRDMAKVPSAVWIVDTKKEHIAVGEARKLNIPVVAVLDTNCDPDEVDYPVPGNDDAIRSAALLTKVVAEAVAAGLMARSGAAAAARPAKSRWPSGSASCSPPGPRPRPRRLLRHRSRCSPTCRRRRRAEPRPTRRASLEVADRRRRGCAEVRPNEQASAVGAELNWFLRSTITDTADSSRQGIPPTMANFSAADVKRLRELTGAGMMDCKKALDESDGDFDKAVEFLRIKGAKDIGKRAERTTAEGLVAAARRRAHRAGQRDRLRRQERRVPAAGRADGQRRRRARGRPTWRACWPRRWATGTVADAINALSVEDRREARAASGRQVRRPDRRLPAQAVRRPAAGDRRAGRSTPATASGAEAARGAAMQIASLKAQLRHPRRRSRRTSSSPRSASPRRPPARRASRRPRCPRSSRAGSTASSRTPCSPSSRRCWTRRRRSASCSTRPASRVTAFSRFEVGTA